MSSVLVTGANGFVGKALCRSLVQRKNQVFGGIRDIAKSGDLHPGVTPAILSDTQSPAKNLLENMNYVVHLASRVHVMQDTAKDPLEEFRKVNVLWTQQLAQAAANAGVKRFVFVSSIKVHGEGAERAYTENDPLSPEDFYSLSKMEAEKRLLEIAARSGMDVVILRPPLVYGEGVQANFLSLLRLVEKGIPLPFGSLRNKRSMVYLGNLVDAMSLCLDHPDASNKTFLVSDGDHFSTPELIRTIASCMGKPARVYPFPQWLLRTLLVAAGKKSIYERLCGSLVADTSKIQKGLGWTPPYSKEQGIQKTVDWYSSR